MNIEWLKIIFTSIVSSLLTVLGLSWKTASWKTGVDKDISENKKDIQNLKNADKCFVSKEDFKDIKDSLKEIQKQLFEIAKNIPTCLNNRK